MNAWERLKAEFTEAEIDEGYQRVRLEPGYPNICVFGGWGLFLLQICHDQRRHRQAMSPDEYAKWKKADAEAVQKHASRMDHLCEAAHARAIAGDK